jgi:hypothetical protein
MKETKQFFFEKKNQKTCAPESRDLATPMAQSRKSFFASCFSKNEVLP